MWTSTPPQCTKTCKEPQCSLYATCTSSPDSLATGRYLNGTVISYSCEQGHDLEGYPSIQCLDDGEWTSTPPQCKKTCWNPGCPRYANCTSSPDPLESGRYLNGTVISYVCEEGHKLEGTSPIQCLNGQLTHNPPSCSAMTACLSATIVFLFTLVYALFY